MAETTSQIESSHQAEDLWSEGQFHKKTRERRAEVVDCLERQSQTPLLAELVYNILLRAVKTKDATLDAQLIDDEADKKEKKASELSIKLPDIPDGHPGKRVNLISLLTSPPTTTTIEVVNALAAIGFNATLNGFNPKENKPLADSEQRRETEQIVALLPGVERVGPYSFPDYLDDVCDRKHATRFWEFYTERLAREIKKRSQRFEAIENDEIPWYFHHLLIFHQHGAPETRGRAWTTLRRHIKRILNIDRDRKRFVRLLLEGVDDLAVLHYVCSSPAVIGDPQLVVELLMKGEEKLVSCALFALQVHGDPGHIVEDILKHFRSQPLPLVASWVTDIYAQLSLPAHPNSNIKNLIIGLRAVILEKVNEGGSVESLVQASPSKDVRAFRKCLLIADMSRNQDFRKSAFGRRLLDHIVTIFFASFTPSEIHHPLNDETFTASIVRVFRALFEEGVSVSRNRDRLESWGLELADHVEKAMPSDVPAPMHKKILARYAIVYARTVIAIARGLYKNDDTRQLSIGLYRALIRVYLEHYRVLEGDCSFGTIEFALRPLYPQVFGQTNEQIDLADLIDASHDIAKFEHEFEDFSEDEEIEHETHGKTPGVSSLLLRKPDRDKPLRAAVEILDRKQTVTRSVLRAYLGLDLLVEFKERLLRLLGLRREGTIILTDREMVVSSKRTLGGRIFERTGDSHAFDDLLAVNVRRRLRLFYTVFGALGLIFAGVAGGHLLFVGLRGQDSTLAILGGALISFGVVFDAAMSRLSQRNENTVVVEMAFRSQPQRFSLAVDTDEGSEILDAFMAGDAERRERALMEDYLHRDVQFEPLDGPIDLED